jgi:sortase (surface protein transpeptidase)
MASRNAALSIMLGAALLVAPPLVWHQSQPPDAVGDLDAVGATGDSDAAAAAPLPTDESPALGALGSRDEGVGESRSPDAPPEDAAADLAEEDADEPVSAPTRLRIPAIDADAPLDPVGLDDGGGMEIPEDVTRVGWYEPGVAPGAAGSAVLAGHVDSRTQGAGVLFRLRELDVDDKIVIENDAGQQRWKVVARASYPKQALPIDELFAWDGPPRLVVITCGGDFDADRGSYEENIVVHAVPA